MQIVQPIHWKDGTPGAAALTSQCREPQVSGSALIHHGARKQTHSGNWWWGTRSENSHSVLAEKTSTSKADVIYLMIWAAVKKYYLEYMCVYPVNKLRSPSFASFVCPAFQKPGISPFWRRKIKSTTLVKLLTVFNFGQCQLNRLFVNEFKAHCQFYIKWDYVFVLSNVFLLEEKFKESDICSLFGVILFTLSV